MAVLTVLSALPVARMYSLKGLKAKQLTSAVCASCCCTVSATHSIVTSCNEKKDMDTAVMQELAHCVHG